MGPIFWGGLIALFLLSTVGVLFFLRRSDLKDNGERFGRYEFTIWKSNSYVDSGTSFRCENPEALDWVARLILEEWLEKSGISENRERYCCRVYLPFYGVGEGWGR